MHKKVSVWRWNQALKTVEKMLQWYKLVFHTLFQTRNFNDVHPARMKQLQSGWKKSILDEIQVNRFDLHKHFIQCVCTFTWGDVTVGIKFHRFSALVMYYIIIAHLFMHRDAASFLESLWGVLRASAEMRGNLVN